MIAAAPALDFIGRYWKLALVMVVIGYVGLLHLRLADEKQHSAKLATRLTETTQILERERSEIRAKTALAQALDVAHSARVERDQVTVSQETISAYQRDIAALRSRAAQRVRAAATATDKSGGGEPAMPGVPNAAGRVDDATGEDRLPVGDALIASEIALRLKALQEWVRGQEKVDR